MTREQFIELCGSTRAAVNFESYVLSAGAEFLTGEERAVLNGEVTEPSEAYWDGLAEAWRQVGELQSCGVAGESP